jgi:hypothetical protein
MTDNISGYDAQLAQLDAKLKPLGSLDMRDSRQVEAEHPDPLDEAVGRATADPILAAVTALYLNDPEAREPIRAMFDRYRSVRWALWPGQEPTTVELLRSWLLGISMRDVGPDPRDMPLKLMRVCRVAAAAHVDVEPVLRSVASVSSEFIGKMMLNATSW